MTLNEEITQAQGFITDPPKNESNTCDWIILPILWSAGYARRDIESRIADNTGQYPDYTLLPNHSSATYYLEAKAWNVTLEDIHVKQALNYANHNGKRFIVLTNGRNWRLYDNAIQGQLADKLLTDVELHQTPQITDFLIALSKPQVLDGSLEHVAANAIQRRMQQVRDLQQQQIRDEELRKVYNRNVNIKGVLDATLPASLTDPEDGIVALITKYLSDQEELSDISLEILSEWFGDRLSGSLSATTEEAIAAAYSAKVHSSSMDPGEKPKTLKELLGRPINGKQCRPIVLQTPDGTQLATTSWVNLAEQIVRWLLRQPSSMPLPFESSNRKRWFLNRVPEHKRPGSRGLFKEVSFQGKMVYMDSDCTARMFLDDLYALCLAMHVAPDAFRITML